MKIEFVFYGIEQINRACHVAPGIFDFFNCYFSGRRVIDFLMLRFEFFACGFQGIRTVAKRPQQCSRVSATDVDSIATFYNLIFRKPVGRHVVMVCDSVSCWIMGYDRVREQLRERLGIEYGQTTPDNRFTTLPIVCLGCCDHAPAMMVDGELHSDLNPQTIDLALDKYK